MQANITDQELFEGIDTAFFTPKDYINTRKLYNYIVESADIAERENVGIDDVIDEGIFSAILGGISGATVGPAIGRAICKVLKIDEKGVLGSLICSKVVLAALGAELGYRL